MKHHRRSHLRRTLAGAAAAATLVFAVGVPAAGAITASDASSAQLAAADEPVTMRIATSGYVDSFNPFTSIYLTPTNIIRYVYESLVQNSAEDGSPTEGLAESWEVTNEGRTWTYTLHDGLTWSDGEPITADDVAWTYDQMMTVPAMGTANGNLVSNFASVEAPDDKTVVIELIEPQAPNPGSEIPVVPRHIWEPLDDPSQYANDTDVVGSGPFTLKSYVPNQSIVLEANPTFWRGAPKIDRIEYVYYTNSDAQVQALLAGDVDFVTGLTPTQYDALQGKTGITTHAGIGRRYTSISINAGLKTPEGEAYGTGSPVLKDIEVRQAMRMAIDNQALLDNVLSGKGTLATSFIPSSFPDWHLPDDSDVLIAFDPDGAKAKLEAAGWTVGSDGIREKDGERLSIRIMTDADSSTEQAIAEYLVPWLKDVGMELQVESTDSDTISSRSATGDYDLYFTGWSVNPDPDYQLGINTCANLPQADGTNGTTQDGYCNPEFDVLYAQQRAELDHDTRKGIVREMLEMNYTDTAQIALWYADSLEAYRSDRFDGFTLQPTEGGIIANQAGYWGFLTVAPVGGDAGSSAGGSNTGLIVAGVGAVVVVAIAGGVIVYRRRHQADTE